MKAWEKAALIGGGLLGFSLLPIWRSGTIRGQNLWQFVRHHSVFNHSDAMWIKPEELKKIRELAHGG